jgi:ATP-dependent RNA helicase DeaD
MSSFEKLGLNSNILQGLEDLGFVEPSPIQKESIPFILNSKKNVIALAQTGTGKTAAFSLPILNQIDTSERNIQAIVICPTRELCAQTAKGILQFGKHIKGLSVTPVYGGEGIDKQIRALKKGTNIVVGTPGRLNDLIRRKVLNLRTIKWVVLDEADEMLDMGFKEDLDTILAETPDSKQTLLFSATMSKSVHAIAKKYMRDAHEITVAQKNVGADNVTHEYYIVQHYDRFEALKRTLDFLPGVYGIIFCRTKNETQEVADKLKQAKYTAEAMHGDVSQNMRTKIMDRFKKKHINLLVATDVAARGIDVNDLTHVINYNLSDQDEAYTHRSGRTGRAQKSGVCISIVSPREHRRIRTLERLIGKSFEQKKVPNGQAIYKKHIENFVVEIENSNSKSMRGNEQLGDVFEKLHRMDKEDLIAYFLTNKFGDLVEEYRYKKDINAKGSNHAGRDSFRRDRKGGGGGYSRKRKGRYGRSEGRGYGKKKGSFKGKRHK